MNEDYVVCCPYCGENVEIRLEADVEGSLVQDCEVCCSPWLLQIEAFGDERTITVSRSDGTE